MNTDMLAAPFEFTTRNLLFNFLASPLSNVPFHENTAAITRYIAEKFPMHLAVHEVGRVINPPALYTLPHVHDEEDEINIIISPGILRYRIMLADEEHIVSSNSSIYIPRGMVHSANVLEGSGFFITIRI